MKGNVEVDHGLELMLKNIHPSDEERKSLKVDGLFMDESIDDRGPFKSTIKTSSCSKKSDFDDIKMLKNKLELVISTQELLASNFIALRSFVDLNFKFLLTVIQDIQKKVTIIYDRPSVEVKTSNNIDDLDSDYDAAAATDDDDNDDKGLLESENIETESANGDESGEDRGDGSADDDECDDKVGADASAIGEVQGDVVAGSEDDKSKDVDNVKGKEVDIKGDNFFKGLSQLEIDDDPVILTGLEAVTKIKVPNSIPAEVVEKRDANVSNEEEDDTVACTPLLDKRKCAPALKSPLVDFQSVDLKTSLIELMCSGSQSAGDERDFKIVTYVKGLRTLDDSFSNPVSPELEAKFDE
ncbi:hypothetical protein CsatA_029852 [Cannabis sativa]